MRPTPRWQGQDRVSQHLFLHALTDAVTPDALEMSSPLGIKPLFSAFLSSSYGSAMVPPMPLRLAFVPGASSLKLAVPSPTRLQQQPNILLPSLKLASSPADH